MVLFFRVGDFIACSYWPVVLAIFWLSAKKRNQGEEFYSRGEVVKNG